jgi:uncharacterized protein (DUF58 family)
MQYTLDPNRIPQYPNLELLARTVVEGFIVGLHKSPFHGFSVEFSEHRLYNSGEPTRHIDWKLYGRTDRLYVKRYEEETNLRCQVVIDISSSMFFPELDKINIDHPNKVTFAVYAAASIMQLLRRQRDALGLSLFSNKVSLHTQAKSNSVHHKFLLGKLEELLTPIPTGEKRNSLVTDSLHFIAENIHKRSLVVIFSDMFDTGTDNAALFDALQHLRYNKHEVILFHVTDKRKELDFEYENRPYRFVDIESGAEIKLQPSEVRKPYIEAINKFYQELKLKCAQYKIDFIEADINKGFEQVLLPYLLKRERMG